MTSIFYKTLLAFSFLSTIGCGSAYYKPTSMNIPNFKEKNEFFLAANAHVSLRGGDVQAAYAVTDHFAVQGNYMKNLAEDNSSGGSFLNSYSIKITKEITFGECAIGYFMQRNNFGTFSLFAGYGTGKVSNVIENRGQATADFSKVFVQSSLGFREKYAEFVCSAKLATLEYTNLNHTYTSMDKLDHLNALKNTIPMLEFGTVMRFGGEKIKAQLFLTAATNLGTDKLFQYDLFTIGFGICTQLNTQKKSKKRTQ
jgi:hypothetical protein